MSWFSVLLVNLLFTGGVLFFLARRIERRMRPGAVLDRIKSEVDDLIVEFNQTTERNVGLLEERIVRLGRLVENADRRVAVLRREHESHEAETKVYSDIALQAAAQRRREEAVAEAEPDDSAEDKRSQIIDLYEKGIASNIIAARVGTTVGEVELIVSLGKRKS